MNILELENKLVNSITNYRKLKMRSMTTTIENPIRIRVMRRNIARIKTRINIKKNSLT